MRQSEEGAYREFAEARMGHLFRSACLLTGGDTHLAEDLVQEPGVVPQAGRAHPAGVSDDYNSEGMTGALTHFSALLIVRARAEASFPLK